MTKLMTKLFKWLNSPLAPSSFQEETFHTHVKNYEYLLLMLTVIAALVYAVIVTVTMFF